MKSFSLISLILLMLCSSLDAQDYTIQYKHFGIENGLITREVLSVFEGKNGFIWIGTAKGLQRYDGQTFKSWAKTSKTGQIYQISNIGQDEEGWLWLWNNELYVWVFLNPLTGEILSQEERFGKDFPVKRTLDNKGWNSPLHIIPSDTKGRFIFTSSSPAELIIYDQKSGFQKIPIKDIDDDFLEIYLIDKTDHLWISSKFTGSTLHKVNLGGQVLASYPFPNSYDITEFTELNGIIYFKVTNKPLKDEYYKIKLDGELEEVLTEERTSKTTSHLGKSLAWIIHKDGWSVYEKGSSNLVFSLDKKDYPRSLFDLRRQFLEDSQGRVWIAGEWGLDLVIARPNRFQNYFSFQNKSRRPVQNSARSILVEEDTILINLDLGGLVKFEKNIPSSWTLTDKIKSRDPFQSLAILRTEDGKLVTGHRGYVRIFSSQKDSARFVGYHDKINKHFIWSLHEDESGRIWLGTSRHLAYIDPNDKFIQIVKPNNHILNSGVPFVDIHQIIPAADQKLWLVTREGLVLFDPSTKSFLERYSSKDKEEYFLPAKTFYHLHIDQDSIFWLGTNEGLIRWDKKNNEKQLFSTVDELSNDVIYAIIEDDQNHLWMSSNYGIMQFDKETFQVRSFLAENGIPHEEFNRISYFQEKDGTIYFGGLNGVTAFHPKDFYQNKEKSLSTILLTNFEIFDGDADSLLNKTKELHLSNSIDFHNNDRFFRLNFSVPNFQVNAKKKVLYAWQIEGVDEDWNYQSENVLHVGKLPYGIHRLKIKGQSNGGSWTSNQLVFTINVLRPFYLKAWFFLLTILITTGSVYFIYKRRTYQLKQRQIYLEHEITKATAKINEDKATIELQAEELRQLDKVKSRFFANVSHELRTPLTLMLGPISSAIKSGQLDGRNTTLLQKAQLGGKNLLKLIGSILDLSKMESGKMELNLQTEHFFSVIRRIISAFEPQAYNKEIKFSFIYQADKDLHLEIDKEKIEIIINNLLSNAMKFTPNGGQIEVIVTDLGQVIQITVNDNGRGIHPEDLPYVFDRFYQSKQPDALIEGGSGIGLALSQEYIKLMKGSIKVESEPNEGSTFTITFPRKEILSGSPIDSLENTIIEDPVEDIQIVDQLILAKTSKNAKLATLLVVEDNKELRNYLETILSAYYHIITAENGQLALQLLKSLYQQEQSCHLVLSDIMMPVMDGYQLLQSLKTNDTFSQIPVIMLTARADNEGKLAALRIGVDDYIIKPFEEEELLVRINNLIVNQQERVDFIQSIELVEEPTQPNLSKEDQEWLVNFEQYIQTHLKDDRLNVTLLSNEFAMSESTLLRQIKRLTGLPPSKYILEHRLSYARQLLENRSYKTIAKVAFEAGFKDPKYFAKVFKSRFGRLPSSYLQQNK